MIEMLLALIVFATASVYLLRMQAEVSEDQRAKNHAQSLATATEVFTNYLLANKDGIVAAMKDGTSASQFCVINANPTTGAGTTANNTTKKTCATDMSFMKFKRIAPASMPDTNDLRQRWTAVYRLVYIDDDNNPATPMITEGTVEMLVGGAINGGNERPATSVLAGKIVSHAGPNAGFIPDNNTWGTCTYQRTGNANQKQACGPAGWSVNLADFLNNP